MNPPPLPVTARFRGWLFLSLLALSFVTVSLVYLPYLTLDAVHHDNTRYFLESLSATWKSSCAHDPQYGWLHIIGRPLAAWTECVVFKLAGSIPDLLRLRWVLAAEVTLLVSVLFHYSLFLGADRLTSAVIATVVGTVPAVNDAVLMTNFVNVSSMLFSSLSFLCLDLSLREKGGRTGNVIGITASYVLLLISLYLYPACSFNFFVPLAIRTLVTGLPLLRRMAICFSVFAIASLTYLKCITAFVPEQYRSSIAQIPPGFRPDISPINILSTFRHHVLSVLEIVLSGPLAPNGIKVGGWAGLVLVLALGLRLKGAPSGERRREILAKTAGVAIIGISCLAPWLMAPGGQFQLRMVSAVGIIAMIVCAWSLRSLIRSLPLPPLWSQRGEQSALVVFMVLALLVTARTSQFNALNSTVELLFLRTQLVAMPKDTRRIHLVMPAFPDTGFDGYNAVGDTFHRPTSVFKDNLPNLIRLALLGWMSDERANVATCPEEEQALARCVVLSADERLIITSSASGAPFCRSDAMVIVDMNILGQAVGIGFSGTAAPGSPPSGAAVNTCADRLPFTVSVSGPHGHHGIERAFDASVLPDSFWEAGVQNPVELTVHFPKPVRLNGYTLQSGEYGGRMPLHWRTFQESQLGQESPGQWIAVSEEITPAWGAQESRTFSVSPGCATRWKFVFDNAGRERILRLYEMSLSWQEPCPPLN